MSAEHYAKLTTFELEALRRRKSRAHDNLIDTAPMGDERIYNLQQQLDAINAELRKRPRD